MKKVTRLHKTLRNCMEKAIREYRMIKPGDRILIGISGGPDSLSLLKLLHERQVYRGEDFTSKRGWVGEGNGGSEDRQTESRGASGSTCKREAKGRDVRMGFSAQSVLGGRIANRVGR